MQLTIHGVEQSFIPIQQFRVQYALPDTFGVRLFEPKDYSGLARLDNAGDELNGVRRQLLASVPAQLSLNDVLPTLDHLREVFEAQLRAINAQVGLREPEIGFAVAGFGDMLHPFGYALLRAHLTKTAPPDFDVLYTTWLHDSTRISTQVHAYAYGTTTWHIQLVNTVYGRVGLLVQMEGITAYVQDGREACPAEGFMLGLLRDIARELIARIAA